MPVVGDSTATDTQDVGGNEVDRLSFRPMNSPLKWPVKRRWLTTLSPTTRRCTTATFKSGTAARKAFEATMGPVGPCGLPGGNVWSTNDGDSALESSCALPLFQNP
jgi:hypothetical protein